MFMFSSTQHSPQSLQKVELHPDLPGFPTRDAALELRMAPLRAPTHYSTLK